jgi:tRNA threonylcarbamoyladenosine biosynthesis protein TsaE
MPSLITHNPSETAGLGESWGRAAQSGWVIGLVGDLGAGKTQIVKGLARGLGITSRIHSPTFTLLNIYSGGRLTLNHIDLYRLETQEQIIAAGLEEYLTPDGVTLIEWAERWFGTFDAQRSTLQASRPSLRWVQIETLTETERRITYDDIGA